RREREIPRPVGFRSASSDEHPPDLYGQRRRPLGGGSGIEQAARVRRRGALPLFVGHVRHVPGLPVGRPRLHDRQRGESVHSGGENRPRAEVHAAQGGEHRIHGGQALAGRLVERAAFMNRHLASACAAALVLVASYGSAQQKATITGVAEIPFTTVPNFLKLPAGEYLGESVAVATNSKGHVFVYHRRDTTRLFEFDRNGTFLKEIGKGYYGFEFAHSVRV